MNRTPSNGLETAKQ
jgi:hypothetical protein